MRVSILIIIISLLGCNKSSVVTNNVLVYGHAGLGFDVLNSQYPINSMAAIEHAFNFYNLDGVEVDIQFTKDGAVFLYHDQFLETSTNCAGEIYNLNRSAIVNCRYRKQFQNANSPFLIELDSLLNRFQKNWPKKKISLNVQDRFASNTDLRKLAELLISKIKSYGLENNCNIECSNIDFVSAAKTEGSEIKSYLVERLNNRVIELIIKRDLDGIVTSHTDSDSVLQEKLSLNGKDVVLYGHLIQKDYTTSSYNGVVALQVDNALQALKYLNRD